MEKLFHFFPWHYKLFCKMTFCFLFSKKNSYININKFENLKHNFKINSECVGLSSKFGSTSLGSVNLDKTPSILFLKSEWHCGHQSFSLTIRKLINSCSVDETNCRRKIKLPWNKTQTR